MNAKTLLLASVLALSVTTVQAQGYYRPCGPEQMVETLSYVSLHCSLGRGDLPSQQPIAGPPMAREQLKQSLLGELYI